MSKGLHLDKHPHLLQMQELPEFQNCQLEDMEMPQLQAMLKLPQQQAMLKQIQGQVQGQLHLHKSIL
ncbi:hypothetical protein HRI_004715600 [Hibiscus trionum]|uniref:Uncharacterized protein n=1 Tax=Hibiscus trionum TaxID=183268 RepID=A0A9W7MPZ7_HIBTR|nr:hypothetical protein HRI_004715600 [Hibiscus trionum]